MRTALVLCVLCSLLITGGACQQKKEPLTIGYTEIGWRPITCVTQELGDEYKVPRINLTLRLSEEDDRMLSRVLTHQIDRASVQARFVSDHKPRLPLPHNSEARLFKKQFPETNARDVFVVTHIRPAHENETLVITSITPAKK